MRGAALQRRHQSQLIFVRNTQVITESEHGGKAVDVKFPNDEAQRAFNDWIDDAEREFRESISNEAEWIRESL